MTVAHPTFPDLYLPIVRKRKPTMVKIEDQEGKFVWNKPVDIEEECIQFVDDNVLASEPLTTQIN